MRAHTRLDELDRLRALRELDILDSLPEEVYDRIVELAAEVCEVPIALFSLVDRDRQWFKARVGIDACETSREVSFCDHALFANRTLIVPDAREDERFAENALVQGEPGIRFYAGVPVHDRAGLPLGTLCVIDREPRELEPRQERMLSELASEIESQLQLRQTIADLRTAVEERAVLSSMIARDVRDLMTTIQGEIERTRARPSDAPVRLESASDAVERLARMCSNFAELHETESRGFQVNPRELNLEHWWRTWQREERLRAARAGVDFLVREFWVQSEAHLDVDILARILVNLLDNALRVSKPGDAILMELATTSDGELRLAIQDQGAGIAPEIQGMIFEPYFSARSNGARGSGLGLSMCQLAVGAMGGSIELESSNSRGTRFVLSLPLTTPA